MERRVPPCAAGRGCTDRCLLFLNKSENMKANHNSCTPNGRHHFCTERRAPPCAAGRGCTDRFFGCADSSFAVYKPIKNRKSSTLIQLHTHQTGGTIFVRRGGCHPVQRGGAVQIFFKRKSIKKITSQVYIYQMGGTIFLRRGGCHPVQRGGAAQIVFWLRR